MLRAPWHVPSPVSWGHVSTLPTYDDVMQLPALIEKSVPVDYLDENDHMNIGRYLEIGSVALWNLCIDLGLGPDYIEERRLTTFTVEQHLRYFSELRLGDEMSAHVRLLERSGKAMHSLAFILDRSRQRLAFILEVSIVNVGMDTRRPADFPDDIAATLDKVIVEHGSLGWEPPLCGVMGIRRR